MSLTLDDGLDPPLPDGPYERPIIAAVLGAVLDRELGYGVVERLTATHVTAYHRGVAGAGVGAGEGMCTHAPILTQHLRVSILDDREQLLRNHPPEIAKKGNGRPAIDGRL